MSYFGKILIILGIIFIIFGVILSLGLKIPFLGKLPGDICIKKGNFTFYFPLVTCIIISIILTLLLRFFTRK